MWEPTERVVGVRIMAVNEVGPSGGSYLIMYSTFSYMPHTTMLNTPRDNDCVLGS
jgi:hypothetical protein